MGVLDTILLWFPPAICSLIFLPCLTYSEWYIDELFAVLRNADARGETPLAELFRNDFWGNPLLAANSWTHKSYRPLAVLSFAGQFKLLGDVYRPEPLRAFNVAVHTTISIMVAQFLHRGLRLSRHWSQLGACWFAAHPVHTENITYLVGRADTLSTLVWLLAALCHQRVRRCPKQGQVVPWPAMFLLLLLCAVLAVVAGLFKESGLTLLVFVAGTELCSVNRTVLDGRGARRGALAAGVAMLFFLALAVVRFQITQGSSAPFGFVDTPIQYSGDMVARTWSYLNQHAFYAKLTVFPGRLSWDYSFDTIPLLRAKWADLRALGVLATYLAITALSSWSLAGRRSPQKSRRAVILGLQQLIIPFVPASNLFFVVGVTVGERLLYTSTVGSVAVIAALGEHLECRGGITSTKPSGKARAAPKCRRWPWRLGIVLLCIYIYRCGRRVWQWRSTESLYMADAASWPQSVKTQHQVGTVFHQQGRYAEALEHYTASLEVLDDNALTDHCIAQIYIETARYPEALERFQKIVQGHLVGFSGFNLWMLHVDYGFTLVALGHFEDGIAQLQQGLARNLDVPHGLNALGYAFYRMQDMQQAQDTFAKALEYDPENPLIWSNLAAVWMSAGALQQALQALERALAIEPNNQNIVYNAMLLQRAAESGTGVIEAPPRLELFFMRMG